MKTCGEFKADGASIYYEVRGSGPLLLMISGGGCDANTYDNVADNLASAYTVVTYDRRGYSRSKLDNPEEVPTIESHGDDAHLLLQKLTSDPAYVFGNSAGAVVGLELVSRYPEQVRRLIAHEPPKVISANPDDDRLDDLRKIIAEGGPTALQRHIGLDFHENKFRTYEEKKRKEENMKFFIIKEPLAISRYKYSLDRLESAAKNNLIIIGGSSTAKEAVGYHGAVMAAKFFSLEIVEFPGNHAGYKRYPKEYARKILEVLDVKFNR